VWDAKISTQAGQIAARFKSELATAWWVDQEAIREHGDDASRINKVEKPANYDEMVVAKKFVHAEPAMQYIKEIRPGTFQVTIEKKRQYFDTLAAAQQCRGDYVAEKKRARLDALAAMPITRTTDGIAYRSPNKHPDLRILLDDEDWRAYQDIHLGVQLSKRKHHADEYYAVCKGGMLHRHILGLTKADSDIVDHLNHQSLDNRRSNLRVTTDGPNSHNRVPIPHSSEFQGVSANRGLWVANIGFDGKQERIGSFSTPEIAAYAYNCRSLELYDLIPDHNKGVVKPDGWTWDARSHKLIEDDEEEEEEETE
jgi:hypothetical protein